MDNSLHRPDIQALIDIAKQAGNAISNIYADTQPIDVRYKADRSPVTNADLAAHQIISVGLQHLTPTIPIVSEESHLIDFQERRHWQTYWLIDPLDGTQEFMQHNGEFTVNIALIVDHHPAMGIVYAPILDTLYYAEIDKGAYKQSANEAAQRIQARPYQENQLTVMISRRHGRNQLNDFLSKLPCHRTVAKGSALKLCIVAEGLADVYPRLSPTSEWDTAAGQCVLEQAGGVVWHLHAREPLLYNTKADMTNPSFIASADCNTDWFQYFID